MTLPYQSILITHSTAALVVFAALTAFASTALGQTGVSGDRISLPEGAGSLEGVGENVNIDPNMGLMSYNLPIQVPEGFPGLTPQLGVAYSSGAGDSPVGVGWDMPNSHIERMTRFGLPEYDTEDIFSVNGSTQLVRVSTDPPIYRARHEGGFVRYTWLEQGDGSEGYWLAEWPDGRKGYFGADSGGVNVDSARVSGAEGTFRYHLVEMTDVWGHRLVHTYRQSANTALVDTIEWVFDGDEARFSVEYTYEPRLDISSDARAGFEERLQDRLIGIAVKNNGITIQRYALTYDDYETSQGVSRLKRFERFGTLGELYPAVLDFTYSTSLGGVCDDEDCGLPFVVSLGNIGADFRSGSANLIDINGDALPDAIVSQIGQNHQFFINTFEGGVQSFSDGVVSAVNDSQGFALQSPLVQVLDTNGDGFTDMLNAATGSVLLNRGQGDWEPDVDLIDINNLPAGVFVGDNDTDAGDGDLLTTQFIDIDGDKRIDIIQSNGAGVLNNTTIFRNDPVGGFAGLDGTDNLDAGFEDNKHELSDINGDGLLDSALLGDGTLLYRLNLGRGQFAEDAINIEGLPFDLTLAEQGRVELEDLNNDGRTDVIVVDASQVRYALNRGGDDFDAPVTLESGDNGLDFPIREGNTTVLYADMNGSGSSDIVWIDPNGNVTYLELFPVQPHLLAKIENGLGMVQEITYATSVEQSQLAAEQGQPWAFELPYAMRLVTQIDVYDTLGDLHEITRLTYRDGFYDGIEKSFRGYNNVETISPGDDSIETGRTQLSYDIGNGDPYRAGLLLNQVVFSGGDEQDDTGRLLQETDYEYEDCPLDDTTDGQSPFEIRYVCLSAQTNTILEGGEEADAAISRLEYDYDEFGNIALLSQLGVVSRGNGQSCAPCQRDPEVFGEPCGPQCVGDEIFTEIEYVLPTNTDEKWILNRPSKVRRFGLEGSDTVAEKIIHYDGADFVGLPEGELTHGAPTRIEVRQNSEGDFIDDLRQRVNDDGRVVEVILPEGDTDTDDDRRFRQSFGDEGLTPTTFEYLLSDADGVRHELRQNVTYDDVWNRPLSTTQWIASRDGQDLTPNIVESVIYDQFGRVTERFFPSDNIDAPSERLRYELGTPVSRIIIEQRSEIGGDFDRQTIRCFDGFGRLFQERRRLDGSTWLVSGFIRFNTRGQAFQVYNRFESDTDACDTEPPADVAFQEITLDALRRPITSTFISGDIQRPRTFEYGPLLTRVFDAEDLDPNSPHTNTPDIQHHDGLGRLTARERLLAADDSHTFTFTYDELGHYRGVEDPQGNAIVQSYDLAGRLTQVEDPDRGITTFTHDNAGRPTAATNALGLTIRSKYDTLGRLVETFDEANPANTRVVYRYDIPRDCPALQCTSTANKIAEIEFPIQNQTGSYWYGYTLAEEQAFMSRRVLGEAFEFEWTYDNTGVLQTRTFPGGQTLDFDHDDAQRLRGISDIVDAIGYDDSGRPNTFQMANGVSENYTYDGEDRAAAVEILAANDALIAHRGLSYDNIGNVLAVTDNAAQPGEPSASAQYTYDALYRLTEAHLDQGRAAIDETLTYEFDNIDNLTAKISSLGAESPAHIGPMTYGQLGAGPRALTEANDLSIGYDAVGQMDSQGIVSIQYDCFNRPANVEGGQQLLRFDYGPGQQKVLQNNGPFTTWALGDHFEIRNGIATVLVDIGGRRIAEIASLSLMAEVYTDLAPVQIDGESATPAPDDVISVADAWISHAHDRGFIDLGDTDRDTPDELLQVALEALLVEEGRTTFLHADHQGNVIALTDGEGQVIETRVYYPFGLERQSTPGQSPASFNNQDLDPAFGFLNYDARLFDPRLGRWFSPDPLFKSAETPDHAYLTESLGAYAGMVNNPTSFRDQDGLSAMPTRGLFALTSALTRGDFSAAGIGGVVDGRTFVGDKDSHALLKTPDGRDVGGFGASLQSFGSGGSGSVPGYFTGGLGAIVSTGSLGGTKGVLQGHSKRSGLTSTQRLTARRAVSTVPTMSLGISAVTGVFTGSGGAADLSALGGASPGGKLIAGGLGAQASGEGRLLMSVEKLGARGSRVEQSGDRALSRLGAPLGGGISRAFGGVTSSLGSTFDQSARLDQSLNVSGAGAASGRAAKRARSTSSP